MKLVARLLIVSLGAILLIGCPEESGNELDTSLFVKNNLNDSLYVTLYGKTNLPLSDSGLTMQDVDIIYQFVDNQSLVIALDSGETRELPKTFSRETIIESPIGEHLYLINVDTLDDYSPETWNRKAGVKRYYLFSLSDYEQINYTMEYP